MHTNSINLTGFDPLETRGIVIIVVFRAGEGGPDGTVLCKEQTRIKVFD